MERTYTIGELALMTGFTDRTLRNYLTQGILKGSKINGAWRFTVKEIEAFRADPYVKEGLRIKRNSVVFDFLAEKHKDSSRACLVLDVPCALPESNALSAFFCKQMESVSDVIFTYDWYPSVGRVILSGSAEGIAKIMTAYEEMKNEKSAQ